MTARSWMLPLRVSAEEAARCNLLFIPLLIVLNPPFLGWALSLLVLSLLGIVIRSCQIIVVAVIATAASASVLAFLTRLNKPDYVVSGRLVVAACAVLFILVTTILRHLPHQPSHRHRLRYIAIYSAAFAYLATGLRTWSSEKSFGVLVAKGEDNGAWLVSLSRSVRFGETVYGPLFSSATGHSTNFISSLGRSLLEMFSQQTVSSNADNALVLVKIYGLLALLTSLGAFMMAPSVIKRNPTAAGVFGVVAGLVGYSFQAGLTSVGHLSAAVAVLFLLLALISHTWLEGSDSRLVAVSRHTLVVLALVAAGQAWFALTGVALIYGGVQVVAAIFDGLRRRNYGFDLRVVIGIAMGCAIIFWILYRYLFASFLQNVLNLDFVRYNLTIPGGYSTANPVLIAAGLFIVIWWSTSRDDSWMISRLTLVAALVLPALGLFIWSYFLPPYTPQYGAWKYLYIAVAALMPVAVVLVGKSLSGQNNLRLGCFGIFSVGVLGVLSPPFGFVDWTHSSPSAAQPWVSVVVKELTQRPERTVACLNTATGDITQNYDMYLCSRMAMGLAGQDDEPDRVWQAGNICTISIAQGKSTINSTWGKNVTVYVNNPEALTSGAGCQTPTPDAPRGWLSSFNWHDVRVVGPDGQQIKPKMSG